MMQHFHLYGAYDGDVHTHNIECRWKRVKKKLRNQSDTSQALFPSYIKEFVWLENYCRTANKKIFSCIIRLIDESYNKCVICKAADDFYDLNIPVNIFL